MDARQLAIGKQRGRDSHGETLDPCGLDIVEIGIQPEEEVKAVEIFSSVDT